MTRIAGSMLAILALCWATAGCGKAKPSAEEPAAPAAAADETAAPAVEAAPAVDASAVVAKVNGKDITEGEVQKVLAMFTKQMGGRIPADQMAGAIPRLRERIVEELVMRQIMLEEVAKSGISLSDTEFEEVKAELAQELPEGTTLETYMAETGTTESEMREQMAVRKMIMAKAEAIAKPTDEEIQAFYDENKESFAQGETVTASHILIKTDPADDDAAKAAKRERIENLRKQAVEGADFAELARTNSDCPSASSGGDLGSFGRGQMVPEFEEAAFAQPTGSVGEVVETQFGYHIIKVSEHLDAKSLDFAEVKPRISDILYSQKQQDAVREYVEGLRTSADIQRFDQAPAEETMLQLDAEDAAPQMAPPAEAAGAAAAPEIEAPAIPEQAEPAPAVAEPAAETAAPAPGE